MPIFKILVTRDELNSLLKEHPELIGRTSIDGPSDMYVGKSFDQIIIDESWTPTDAVVRKHYERLKRRLSL